LLSELIEFGYVKQLKQGGEYLLTTKLVSLGLSHLSKSGVVDVAQPLLDRLAEQTGELVRLAIVDGERLTWVARAQGARQGLRYDPDMGSMARLSCSSSGWAWLSTMKDADALSLIAKQGMGSVKDYGPNAPKNTKAFLKALSETRAQGYSLTEETYAIGLNALAVPVALSGHLPMGTISVAGPSARFTKSKMLKAVPDLLSCAAQLAAASGASPLLAQGKTHLRLDPIYAL
jgi:DNA-binding IclR family transcriptional regulator